MIPPSTLMKTSLLTRRLQRLHRHPSTLIIQQLLSPHLLVLHLHNLNLHLINPLSVHPPFRLMMLNQVTPYPFTFLLMKLLQMIQGLPLNLPLSPGPPLNPSIPNFSLQRDLPLKGILNTPCTLTSPLFLKLPSPRVSQLIFSQQFYRC